MNIGFGYEQAEPGVYLSDDKGMILWSEDVTPTEETGRHLQALLDRARCAPAPVLGKLKRTVVLIGERYEHYKRDTIYEVMGRLENLTDGYPVFFIRYKDIKTHKEWLREEGDFTDVVETPDGFVPRFALIED